MKRYGWLTILLISVILGASLLRPARPRAGITAPAGSASLRSVFPEALRFSAQESDLPYYRAYGRDPKTGQSRLLGLAFRTRDLAPEISGYAGPIDLMVGIDPQGTIVGLHLLHHSETSAYVGDLPGYLRQFLGRGLDAPLRVGEDIDAISRATVTSTAVAQSLRVSLDRMRAVLAGPAAAPLAGPKPHLPLVQILLAAALYFLAAAAFLTRNRWLRRLALLGGFLYLGWGTRTMLSSVLVANALMNKRPDPYQLPLWYILILGTPLLILLLGNIYCGSLCPFAAIQDLLFKLGRRCRLPLISIPARLDLRLRYIKHLFLLAALGLALAVGNADVANLEVYTTLFSQHGSLPAWICLIVVLGTAFCHPRLWCKFFCPTGALNGLLAHRSWWQLRIQPSCTRCGVCQTICPVQAISALPKQGPAIDQAECVRCNNCVRACPGRHIVLRRQWP